MKDHLPPLPVVVDFVADAIAGKYGLERSTLENIISDAYLRFMSDSTRALEDSVRPVENILDDVSNQINVLVLIETQWRFAIPQRPLQEIQRISLGVRGAIQFRQVQDVADFGGPPPVEPTEITPRLDEIENICVALTPRFADAGWAAQSAYLALVFAAVIRIHPFVDGNGRVARFLVQLLLRCWELPFMPLPKVRNDEAWLAAVKSAIMGDTANLAKEFARRLRT